MRYIDQHQQEVYQAQLKNKQQKPSKTLHQCKTEIAGLIALAYRTAPKEFIDRLMVQTFINWIRELEIIQCLRLGNRKTLEDALARALEFEATDTSKPKKVTMRSKRQHSEKLLWSVIFRDNSKETKLQHNENSKNQVCKSLGNANF